MTTGFIRLDGEVSDIIVYSLFPGDFTDKGNALISASADKTVMCWEVDPQTRIWVNIVRVGDVGGDTLGFYNALYTQDEIIASAYNGSIHIWREIKNDSKTMSYISRIG